MITSATPPVARGMRIRPAGPVHGRLPAPGSKSMTIRHLVLAALAPGQSVLTDPLEADDTAAVREAVSALGATVLTGEREPVREWIVSGTGGALQVPDGAINCRMSGTTLRIITAVATHAPGPVTVTGDDALRRRPIGVLVEALRSLGGRLGDDHGYPPVKIAGGGLAGGSVSVDVTASSQFVSAILLAAPLARAPVEVAATGMAATAYIDLTAEALGGAGVHVETAASPATSGTSRSWWRVHPCLPRPGRFRVDHDASAACHLFALAMATGGTVTVTNAGATRQPDARLVEVFTAMGATVERDGDALTVTGPQDLSPVDVDLSAMPDQVTTVAVLAALARGTSSIRGVGVTRGHETDRLAALAGELVKVGASVSEDPAALHITGVERQRLSAPESDTVRLVTHNDHRLAMAFTALGSRLPGIVVDDPGCVGKTYPAFWQDVARLGVNVMVES